MFLFVVLYILGAAFGIFANNSHGVDSICLWVMSICFFGLAFIKLMIDIAGWYEDHPEEEHAKKIL